MGNELRIKVRGGYIKVTQSTDPAYPGVYVEFISDKDNDKALSNPQILFEQPFDFPKGQVHAYVWSNPSSEEYTQEIIFKR